MITKECLLLSVFVLLATALFQNPIETKSCNDKDTTKMERFSIVSDSGINERAVLSDSSLSEDSFSDEEIVSRYMAAMINEAARVLDEGIAMRPLDIDVVLLYGYGFPRWRGGPMHTADQRGLETVLADIQRYAEQDDHFWQPAPLLTKLVEQGRNFDSLNHS